MPANHSRHIALTASLAAWIDAQVRLGRYSSASDLVRAAVRLLMAQEEDRLPLALTAGSAIPLDDEASTPRSAEPAVPNGTKPSLATGRQTAT